MMTKKRKVRLGAFILLCTLVLVGVGWFIRPVGEQITEVVSMGEGPLLEEDSPLLEDVYLGDASFMPESEFEKLVEQGGFLGKKVLVVDECNIIFASYAVDKDSGVYYITGYGRIPIRRIPTYYIERYIRDEEVQGEILVYLTLHQASHWFGAYVGLLILWFVILLAVVGYPL